MLSFIEMIVVLRLFFFRSLIHSNRIIKERERENTITGEKKSRDDDWEGVRKEELCQEYIHLCFMYLVLIH